jgi:hypothetical protein
MKKSLLFCLSILMVCQLQAQTNPVITSWLINNTGLMGRHYVKNNSTPIEDNVLANVQTVQYSTNWVYVQATGIPAYITGPFLDGNPSLASAQTGYFKIPQNPVQNTGNPTNTTGGNIGVFINGVALFDYRDGVSWQNASQSLKGGPLGGMGDNVWNRDAVVAERFHRWKHELHVLEVDVRPLAVPLTLPWRESYGGCRSWVELQADGSAG